MHMSYWFGTNLGDLFFQGFTITSVPGFVSTCFGVASLAILFEALRVVLVSVRQQAAELAQLNALSDGHPTEVSSLLINRRNRLLQSNFKKCLMIFNQLILFTTQEVFAYSLMLLVMTYNGYFTIAAVLGAGIGFFIFSPALMEISLRRRGTSHSKMFCATCIEKSKQFEENDEENASLRHTTEGVMEVVADSLQTTQSQISNETKVEGPHSSVQVALVHSTNEEVC